MRWLNLLFVLLINAVPLIGVKYHGWSASTVVALYWFENLAVAVFTCARIALHRKLTRKRGHWRTGQLGTKVSDKPSGQGLFGEYAVMAFVFTLAHGIFVGAFTLIAAQNHAGDPLWAVSGVQLRQGALWMSAAMTLEFFVLIRLSHPLTTGSMLSVCINAGDHAYRCASAGRSAVSAFAAGVPTPLSG